MSTLVMFIRIKLHALSILKGKGLHKGMNIRRWRLLGPSWSLSVIVIAFHRKGAFSVEKVNISVWKVELRRKFPMCICCSVTVVSSFLQPHGLQKKKKKKIMPADCQWRGVSLWTGVRHPNRTPTSIHQLPISKIKQTFLSTNLVSLMAFERWAVRPHLQLEFYVAIFSFC